MYTYMDIYKEREEEIRYTYTYIYIYIHSQIKELSKESTNPNDVQQTYYIDMHIIV